MDDSGLIIILVVVGILAFIFLRGVNPKTKTDAQLRILHSRALQAGNWGEKDRLKIEEEMKRRGMMGESGGIERPPSDEGHLVQLRATKLRNAARTAYDDGRKKAEGQGKSERFCHESGLTNVLFMRLQAEPDCPPVSEELFGAIMLEQMPFNALEPESGKEAMAEYVVWREHPELANEEIIRGAVESLRENGLDEILETHSKESLSWIPWSKLL